ncbi:MAG: alpha/beta hydrolase [Myxococcota bacterium]|nr:alpha/beta hydrolase [Myxococcota bacterium]
MTRTTKRIQTGDVEIAYEEAGVGERPFLLVHGFTGSRDDFREVIDPLSAHGRTLAPDLRGHGETSHMPPDTYHLDSLVDDLGAFASAVDAERFDLLGHSMGGMTAMRFALAHPERVSSLILMDTAPAPPDDGRRAMIEAGAKLALAAGMGALFEVIKKAGTANNPPAMRRIEAEVGTDAYWARIERKFQAMDPHAFAGFVGTLNEHESVLDRLSEIRCPTTVLVGDQDLPFLEPSRAMAERIPGSELIVIDDAAHSPQIEQRGAWLEAVEDHLRRAR